MNARRRRLVSPVAVPIRRYERSESVARGSDAISPAGSPYWRAMDPARKRSIRLVVALSCALLLARGARLHQLLRRQRGARAEPARDRRARRRRTSSPARCERAPTAQRHGPHLPGAGPRRRGLGARSLRRPAAGPVPGGARGRSSTCASRAACFVGPAGLADHEVPVEVLGRPGRHLSRAVLTAGSACLIIALAICLYGIGASLYGARTGRREVDRLRPPRRLRAGRRARRGVRDPRGGVRAHGPERSRWSRATPRPRRRPSTA